MAASSVSLSDGWISNLVAFDNIINKNNANFEELQSCVTEEVLNSVARGIRQLLYWKERLQPIVSNEIIIMTCISPQGIFRPDIHILKGIVTDILGKGRIKSIYYPENTNFVGLLFHNAEEAKAVRHGVSRISGAPVCYVDKKAANEYNIRILWAPPHCQIEPVVAALSRYCYKSSLEFERTAFKDGEVLSSNIISGSIVLKENSTLQDLPHVLKIVEFQDKHVLLVVRGRPPICLRCRHIGHIRKTCPDKKCILCHVSHPPDESCLPRTYVAAARTGVRQDPEDTIINEGLDYPEGDIPSVIPVSKVQLHVSSDDVHHRDYVLDISSKQGLQGQSCDEATLITKRPILRKGKKLDSLISSSKSMFISSNIFSPLDTNSEWGEDLEDSGISEDKNLNKKVPVHDQHTLKTNLSQSLQKSDINPVSLSGLETSKKQLKWSQGNGLNAERKKSKGSAIAPNGMLDVQTDINSSTLTTENISPPFCMEKIDGCLTSDHFEEVSNKTNQFTTVEPSTYPYSEGVVTRSSSKALASASAIQSKLLTHIQNSPTVEAINDINLQEEFLYEISIKGIPDAADYKSLVDLLLDYDYTEYWFYDDEPERSDEAGVGFSSRDNAEMALGLDGSIWLGTKISVTRHNYN